MMPEMPEIETIRRSLEPHIQGRKITSVEVLLPRQIKWPEPESFVARILQTTIAGLDRRGKYLLLQLDNQVSLIFHLRMTGQLVYVPSMGQDNSHHNRLIIHLDDGSKLIFSDTRTFGTLYAMHQDELWRIQGMAELGPEPLSPEFTVAYLSKAAEGRKTKIKSFLLDQRKVGGLGNIYVDEALFLAGIHPLRLAGSLTLPGYIQHCCLSSLMAQNCQLALDFCLDNRMSHAVHPLFFLWLTKDNICHSLTIQLTVRQKHLFPIAIYIGLPQGPIRLSQLPGNSICI